MPLEMADAKTAPPRAQFAPEHLRVSWILTLRWLRELKLAGAVGIGTVLLLQPMIWLLIFGSLFSFVSGLPGFPTSNYYGFIVPGVIVFTNLGFLAFGGGCIIHDFESGFLSKMWAAPIGKLPIVTGRTTWAVILSAFQTAVILLVSLALGVSFSGGLGGVVMIFVLSEMLVAGLTALSLTVAFFLKYEFAFQSVTTFLITPLIFLSTALLPLALMPWWMRPIAAVNPVTPTVDAIRDLVSVGFSWGIIAGALGLLAAFDVLMFAIAALAFRRKVS
ncbi:MAG: ABC transporter permease [Nitrososphaerota archaeon]|nr:ABC transporter permease [Nitrososphaerota archaeon]MDG7022624.1 ABC transporter permease [Nitrososphaerota archaeon]